MKVIIIILIFITTLFSNESHVKALLQLNTYNNQNFYHKDMFSKTELDYMKHKKEIKMCVDPDWMPFERIKNGKHVGLASGYIKVIQNIIGIPIRLIKTKDWDESVSKAKNRECDIFSMVPITEKRKKYMDFTSPYIAIPMVIATKNHIPFIDSIERISDKKIGVVKSYSIVNILKEKYPHIDLIEVESIADGLEKVEEGEIFAFVDNLATVTYEIQKSFIDILKISGILDIRLKYRIATRNDEPILKNIFEKIIASIDENTKDGLFYRWINSPQKEKVVDYTLVWKLIGLFLIILMIILLIYMREKKLSKIIKEEKDKFQNIFDKASDGTSILTDGIFTDCNDSLVKILGYKNKNQVLNLTPSQLSPEYQPDGEKSLDKSMQMMKTAKEEGVNHFEWRHIRADGEAFWTDIMLTDVSTKDDETMIHVIWRDIQHRKELEEDLIELNTSLAEKVEEEVEKNRQHQFIMSQQARHAQMGEMISMIAHQWRQPLNNLSMIIQGAVLKHKLGKLNDEFMVKLSEDSQNQIMQMSQTIDDFRYFFKPSKHARVFSVNAAIEHALTLFKPILEQELIVVEMYLEDDVSIKGFSNELEQVLINILNNAKDVLAAKNRDKKKIITIILKVENRSVVITIEDNAGGIEDDIIDKIFDPYFSTKEGRNGTGLGLYISKRIIEGHSQGQLSVKNGTNGAIFKIELGGIL